MADEDGGKVPNGDTTTSVSLCFFLICASIEALTVYFLLQSVFGQATVLVGVTKGLGVTIEEVPDTSTIFSFSGVGLYCFELEFKTRER